jgi:hypothetical protein
MIPQKRVRKGNIRANVSVSGRNPFSFRKGGTVPIPDWNQSVSVSVEYNSPVSGTNQYNRSCKGTKKRYLNEN